MDFHGHINLRDNEMQKMVLQTEETFPTPPTVGRLCFKDLRVWICIDALTPVWVPLSATTNTYVHTQSSSSATWTIPHNLNTVSPIVQIYDSADKMLIPDSVLPSSNDTIVVNFQTAMTGYAVVMYGKEGSNAIFAPDPVYNLSQFLRGYWKGDDTLSFNSNTVPSFVQYDAGIGTTSTGVIEDVTETIDSASGWTDPTLGNMIVFDIHYYEFDSTGTEAPALGTIILPTGFTEITSLSWAEEYPGGGYIRRGHSVAYKVSDGTEADLTGGYTKTVDFSTCNVDIQAFELSEINTTSVVVTGVSGRTASVQMGSGSNLYSFPTLTVGAPTNSKKRFYVAGYTSEEHTGVDLYMPNNFATQLQNGANTSKAIAYWLGNKETAIDFEIDLNEPTLHQGDNGYLIAFETTNDIEDDAIADEKGKYTGTATVGISSTAGLFTSNAITSTAETGRITIINNTGGWAPYPDNNILTGTSKFSFSFWIKGPAGAQSPIFEQGNILSSLTQGAIYATGTGEIAYDDYVGITLNHSAVSTTAVLDDTDFHHVVIVRNGANLKIYVDNVIEASSTESTASFSINAEGDYISLLSSLQGTGDSAVDIILEDFAVWAGRALTAKEVTDIYTRGLAGKSLLVP